MLSLLAFAHGSDDCDILENLVSQRPRRRALKPKATMTPDASPYDVTVIKEMAQKAQRSQLNSTEAARVERGVLHTLITSTLPRDTLTAQGALIPVDYVELFPDTQAS
ncbi:hypothetical protein BP6252_13707 [Coleophoma cylindrospora]|uniref:Uncharacterized protein n=1 Tax=Coleophoma cylindrospora TaxID=1849047 RepID=A0A3D8Q707_9HELO|nr:hypothetical protein BP6252_13707 [Coleophoma cylindrospora]